MSDEEIKNILNDFKKELGKEITKLREELVSRMEIMEQQNTRQFEDFSKRLKQLSLQVEIMEVKQNGIDAVFSNNQPLKSDLEWTYRRKPGSKSISKTERIPKWK